MRTSLFSAAVIIVFGIFTPVTSVAADATPHSTMSVVLVDSRPAEMPDRVESVDMTSSFLQGQVLSADIGYAETLSVTGLGSGVICNGAITTVDLTAPTHSPLGLTIPGKSSAKACQRLSFSTNALGGGSVHTWLAESFVIGTTFPSGEQVLPVPLHTQMDLPTDSSSTYAAGEFDVGYEFQNATSAPAGSYTSTVIFSAAPSF